MKKNWQTLWQNPHFRNVCYILALLVWIIIGSALTDGMQVDQTEHVMYFGENAFFLMIFRYIPMLAVVYLIFREGRLLLGVFKKGTRKTKILITLGISIPPLVLCVVAMYPIFHSRIDPESLREPKGIGHYNIRIGIQPGLWEYKRQPGESCYWRIVQRDGELLYSDRVYDTRHIGTSENPRNTRLREFDDHAELQIFDTDKEFENFDCGEMHFIE